MMVRRSVVVVVRVEHRDVDQVLQVFLRQVQVDQMRHPRVVIPRPDRRHVRAHHDGPTACAVKTANVIHHRCHSEHHNYILRMYDN